MASAWPENWIRVHQTALLLFSFYCVFSLSLSFLLREHSDLLSHVVAAKRRQLLCTVYKWGEDEHRQNRKIFQQLLNVTFLRPRHLLHTELT